MDERELMPVVEITPETLLQTAVQSGATIENLKALMDLYRLWKKDLAEAAFNKALNVFQENVAPIKRSSVVKYPSKNGMVDFKFADLSEIMTTIKPALGRAGLSVNWANEDKDGKLNVTCFVSHTDGHKIAVSMEGEPDESGSKNKIQAKGSVITYMRRYTVSMALGIVTEDDTDGNQPVNHQEHPKGKKIPTEKQLNEMKVRIEAGRGTIEQIKEVFEITPEQEAKLLE